MTNTSRRTALVMAAAVVAALAAPTLAFGQEPAMIKGMILKHAGNRLVVKTATGETPVRIQDTTKIESTKGVLGMRREARMPNELIPGLAVQVEGTMEGSEFVASTIGFNPDDLKTAQQIQAGLHGTNERLDSVGELAKVGSASVYFASGSSKLSEKGKQDLQGLVTQAKTHKGYRLAVVGRADPTGSTAANQRLSEARAASVIAYLIHSLGVLPGSLLPATAVGESPIFEDPNPPRSAAEARRVTVTAAVSKATLAETE